jgi:FkbM family methyltransferase
MRRNFMAFLHRTRVFVNELLSPFGIAINRIEKQPSKCFRTTVSTQERVQLYETSTGRYYLPTDAPQDHVISCIKSGGVFEPEVVETAKAYIWRGSTVLDVGANFGQMSVLFSRFVGTGGHVHSFEADPFVYELLQKTLAANNCQNVTARLGAVYDRPNQQLFYRAQDFTRIPAYGSYGIDPNATAGRTVKTLTIDGLNINTPISFIKVDIQGSDLFALRGAVETIKRHRMPIIFEFEQEFQAEFGTSFQDYVDFVDSISYRFEKLVMERESINYLIVPR